MTKHLRTRLLALGLCTVLPSLAGCGDGSEPASSFEEVPVPGPSVEPSPPPVPEPSPTPELEQTQAALTHAFPAMTLGPGEEIAADCVAWTLDNEKALYVNEVTLVNGGGYHHSNWFVVPEHVYAGPDGRFSCAERGFDENLASVAGAVIFAQSTQSFEETQAFAPGVVLKIPPRHKVVSSIHLLNVTTRPQETFLRMTLGLVHPRDVEVILSGFRLNYGALDIPPQSEALFTGECDLAQIFEDIIQEPFELKLHWVLPHYHYLGTSFRVEVFGGPNDGQVIHSIGEFNAEPNGLALDPPIDLTGARGLRFSCGYRNPRDESVKFGIGDQEMCVMLGLAESKMVMSGDVHTGNQVDGVVDGVVMNSGPCQGIGAPVNPAQTLPSPEELQAPLYVPASLPGDADLPVAPPCVDTRDVLSELPTTLSSISEDIFQGSCSFSACHDDNVPAGGLDLTSPDLHTTLLEHTVTTATTSLPLVAPGDPEGSWLYQLLSRCEPEDDTGRVVAHMPRNSPRLLEGALVAKVRDWILQGAPDS